jgi:drug/metabolite transporter (DMT)-like permease
MPTSALLLSLGAALVHAVWNVLLARARDPRAATAVALLVAEVVFAIPAAVIWDVHRAAWPFIVGSGALQLLYFTLLITAYRLAPLSVVYPIARGGAPVLVLIFGVTVLGHGTSVGQVLGVCLVAAGILLVRGARPTVGRGVALGVCVAGVIATYTLVDKVGVTHAGALPYLELSMIVPSLTYAAIYSPQRLRAEINLSTVVAGVATFGAYCMVLLALQRASAASVAAVRETSVVVGAFLAWRFLKEPVGLGRLSGAVLVAGGIALVSLA